MINEEDVRSLVEQMLSDHGDPLTVHVIYRSDKDCERYARQILDLQAKLDRYKQQEYQWSTTGYRYLQALDELRECIKLLKAHGVNYNSRALKSK